MPENSRLYGDLNAPITAARLETVLPQSPQNPPVVADDAPVASPRADQSVTHVFSNVTEAIYRADSSLPSGLHTEQSIDLRNHCAADINAIATPATIEKAFSTFSDDVEPLGPSSPENVVSLIPSSFKGKNVDPSERPNRMTPAGLVTPVNIRHSSPVQAIAGPSRIHSSVDMIDPSNTTLIESHTAFSSVTSQSENYSLAKPEYPPQPITTNTSGKFEHPILSPCVENHLWFPRITPYRLFNLLIPAIINTAKAVVTAHGAQTLPITLEWISGIVVFLV